MRSRSADIRRRWAPLLAATLLFAPITAIPRSDRAAQPRRDSAVADSAANAHEEGEGLILAWAAAETARRGGVCPHDAPVRRYDVVAINVDVTLNRYLDHDPEGRMYALAQDVARIRGEEKANARARAGKGAPAVSPGLQNDAIQPLVLRVRQGECLVIAFANELRDEPASIHAHGAGLLTENGQPALESNPRATVAPGGHTTLRWSVASDEPEGSYYFHSHAVERVQTDHGLFGVIVVEPAGANWTDPSSGKPIRSGWAADVAAPRDTPFREYVLDYHEIGDEKYRILDAKDQFVPQVDPTLGAYRPGTRALNYRSEPFMNRMLLQQQQQGRFDESTAYSSYTFGDPATPIARAYLSDRVKQRVVHGGGESMHVHHVHGGSIRWQRLSSVDDGVATQQGLQKHPPLTPKGSERVDSQTLGPSETFDTENECGAGGCQQSAGDFLYHCHVAHHYFAGMWGLWRVYNTLQDATGSTDALPPLRPLVPAKAPPRAVTAEQLKPDLAAGIEAQLPPAGTPKRYDAAVWDWAKDDRGRYVGEPDDTAKWAGADATAKPGVRRPVLFDPKTGRVAFPLLRPHLGQRPPFAPNHGPAPFLDPTQNGRAPPAPGASGPRSLCPRGTTLRTRHISAVPMPVPRNQRQNLIDGQGELFVLQADRAALGSDPTRRVPLAIRTNAGKDCIDVLFRSELEDDELNHGFAKVSLHIHMVQFDVQGSDGVDAGFNYEQSVRPYKIEAARLATAVRPDANAVTVSDASRFQPGVVVGVGLEENDTVDIRRVAAINGNSLLFDAPLEHAHARGVTVSTEFLRQRWYPDAQFGTAYFHDHVNGLRAWSHGLIGALISEPPDATWHDPTTGDAIDSGPLADVHTDEPVTMDVKGSFREHVSFLGDDDPINRVGRSSGSSFNLRAESLAARSTDPAQQFSSAAGDPETPVVRAYVGDPVVFRTLVPATNDVHSFHVDGHQFRTDSFNPKAPLASTMAIGISERFDLAVPAAGGPGRRAGDYLIANARTSKLQEGSWGILRVLDPAKTSDLQRLPGRDPVDAATGDICPAKAVMRSVQVDAVDRDLPMLDGPGQMFVVRNAKRPDPRAAPQPLVLHAGLGDCLDIALTNKSSAPAVSLHALGLSYDPDTSGGLAIGREPVDAAPKGETAHYRFYADPKNGEGVALLLNGADIVTSAQRGLYGAVVIGPAGAVSTDPASGRTIDNDSAWSVDVNAKGKAGYRDVTLFLQDEDAGIGTHRMPYTSAVEGPVAINYQRAPFTGARPVDPSTPLIQAIAGDHVRLHVVVPTGEQAQVFSVEGHDWATTTGTGRASSVTIGAWDALTLDVTAGGPVGRPGDYEYGDHREPYREAGMWGRMVVACPGALPIESLGSSGAAGCAHGGSNLPYVAGAVLALVAAGFAVRWAKRSGFRRAR